MNTTAHQLKKNVMRRVYAFWFLRTAYHSVFLKLVLLGFLLLMLRELISLRDVIANTLHAGDIFNMFGYLGFALTHTHLSVQIITLLGAIILSLVCIDTIKKDFGVFVPSRV